MPERSAAHCAVGCPCGPNGELLLCGYKLNHEGTHSWATLPTFFNGRTALEQAAIEFIDAERAWADVVAESGRINDPKRPEDERRVEARDSLIQAVGDVIC